MAITVRTRTVRIVGGIILGLVVIFYLLSRDDPLESALNGAIDAVFREDMPRLMGYFAEDYRGQFGNTKVDLRLYAQRGFEKYDKIKIITPLKQTNKQDHKAVIDLRFKVVATFDRGRFYLAGSFTETERAIIQYIKKDGRWLIQSIEFPQYSFKSKQEIDHQIEAVLD